MLTESMNMLLSERAAITKELLRPDDIHNHHVAGGVLLTPESQTDLEATALDVATLQAGMANLSQAAMDAPSTDRTMRAVRSLLGTEPLHQAALRGEIARPQLPTASLTKSDLVVTSEGLRIVEVEPGKIRGLGYAHMVRQLASRPVGVGAMTELYRLADSEMTAIVLSKTDRFHEPEMSMLVRGLGNVVVASQSNLRPVSETSLRHGATEIRRALMMSPLHNIAGMSEAAIRQRLTVVSDRRPDLESKSMLALLHNAGNDPDIESLLLERFDVATLSRLRARVPQTIHLGLLKRSQQDELKAAIESGELPVFIKPINDSGTRGILTPGQRVEQQQVLTNHKQASKYVIQAAQQCIPMTMQSQDVLTGEEAYRSLNLRVTIHTNPEGQIVESSVVGSAHEHLAHGGKTSVITNLEGPIHG